MKIGNPADKPPVAPLATGQTPTGATARGAAAVPGAAEASAQVDISHTAASLMSGVGGNSAEFDADKVARIAQQIADGSFKVDHAAIADKLIANAQELLSKASH